MKTLKTHGKRMLMALMVMACMFSPKPARAQFGVIDVANLGESIYQFIENNFQHAENLIEMGKQLETAMMNLENAKQTLQTMKNTFMVAKRYFDAAGVFVDIYNLCDQVYRDGELAYGKIQQWSSTGRVSPSQIYSLARIIKYSVKDVEDIVSYLTEEVFSEENQMTTAERMAEVRVKTQEAQDIAGTIYDAIYALDDASDDKMKEFATTAMFMTMAGKSTVTDKDIDKYNNLQEKLQETLDNSMSGEGAQNGTANSADGKRINIKTIEGQSLKEKVIDIVFFSVTILAIIFFGWNFGVYNHGDKQRSDVLWKVGAGYIVMVIAIQIFKIVIFQI